jgi:hypothetical protein
MPSILDALRTHLINAGIGRDPRVAGSLPPIWRAPGEVYAPGEGNNATEVGTDAVVALFQPTGIASGDFEAWIERPIVQVWARTTTAPKAVRLLKQIKTSILGNTVEPAVALDLGGLFIISAREWQTIQPLTPQTQGWTYTWSVRFEHYVQSE